MKRKTKNIEEADGPGDLSWENTQKEIAKMRAINYQSLRSDGKFDIFSRSEGDDVLEDVATILSYWNRMKPAFA